MQGLLRAAPLHELLRLHQLCRFRALQPGITFPLQPGTDPHLPGRSSGGTSLQRAGQDAYPPVQFSPFAALTGHDAAIAEAARLTDERPILDESVKQEISDLLQLASTDSNLVLNIVYFVPDERKAGGSYTEISGRIKKLIQHEKLLIMDTGTRIPVEEIVKISINATLALKVCP